MGTEEAHLETEARAPSVRRALAEQGGATARHAAIAGLGVSVCVSAVCALGICCLLLRPARVTGSGVEALCPSLPRYGGRERATDARVEGFGKGAGQALARRWGTVGLS